MTARVVVLYATVAGTAVVPCCRNAVAEVTVAAVRASLKTAETVLFTATPVAALAGTVDVTVGATTSEGFLLVKDHTASAASGRPARSVIPPGPPLRVTV